jgi:hypothetical protein
MAILTAMRRHRQNRSPYPPLVQCRSLSLRLAGVFAPPVVLLIARIPPGQGLPPNQIRTEVSTNCAWDIVTAYLL